MPASAASMLTSILTLFLACPLLQDAPLHRVESSVDRVTVYDKGYAEVERVFSFRAVEPGERLLVVGPLPLSLDTESCRARLESGPAGIEGLDLSTVSGATLSEAERLDVSAQLAQAEKERRALDADLASIQQGRKFVEMVMESLATGAVELSAEELESKYEFVRTRSAELDREDARYQAAVKDYEERIADLKLLLGEQNLQVRNRYQEARVRLVFDEPGTAVVRVSYLMRDAYWWPSYDVHVASDLTGVTVRLVAQVYQSTGEDWNDVQMLLTTTTPKVGLDVPESPLQVFQVPEAGFRIDGPEAAEEAVAAPRADLRRRGFGREDLALRYRLVERHTLRSNGQPERYDVRVLPLDVRPYRYVVPRESELAYLRATIYYEGDDPLLPGKAKIFLGADYLGEESFPGMDKGSSTVVDLGVDPDVVVDVETVIDERDEPGWFSSTVTLNREYRAHIKLKPEAGHPVNVLVEDTLPITRTDLVEVTPTRIRPAPIVGPNDLREREERGVYRWRFRLAPGQGQNVRWGYTASFDEELEPELVELRR